MAKKKMGRPRSGRDDVTVKIDRSVAFQLKQIAGHRGKTATELLTEITRGPVGKSYLDMLKELGGGT